MTLSPSLEPQVAGPDYAAIKTKQQAVWGAGDYARIGVTLQVVGERLCEAMDLHAGQSVLDVAGGNGNASLAAARRFCKVVSTDYVEALLAKSARRAEAEGLAIDYQTADAENLPFGDATFDNVISTYGVMFTPNQAQAAAELCRVCRPGGKIGLANWTPAGFIGQLFKTVGRYVAPPAGVSSPAVWGTREFLDTHFGPHVQAIEAQPQHFTFRYQSPQHWLDVFSTYYGPTLKAFEALDDEAGQALRGEILTLIEAHNRATDGTMVVPSEYLEIVITR
ncbi:methyltransferase domain-containing protein [Halomonas sp. MCCC 1A17488]|uniref:class I SAM-dependent methyltransferase n=1 Tax=unclassified Halomonas TaxID=2609666 RepID=UPI0018D23500|nr:MULTISPECIES: class I SAM-dependent methyltransferase [unclassified Halomonas]MCE8016929.1 methyltransferase domain-containing protein [Halomonas sp. MCCC 1A17488]MCG3240262.1 methyltransferase domain-containing protein [Halomonas sp. MCCC 1A17488]QPP49862.1 methyltransferase domain-containing protein [Halomonas sp. SS10-MC5]